MTTSCSESEEVSDVADADCACTGAADDNPILRIKTAKPTCPMEPVPELSIISSPSNSAVCRNLRQP
jgi:hypothetical protein